VVLVGQATPNRFWVPGAAWAVPGAPLVMGTTTPSVVASFWPTASHAVELGQATPFRKVPGTTWTVPGVPLVMGTTTPSMP
jgi:hypothetical protein